ncbi:MAG: right-handed parallel beta-helix repeat-containing protein [Methanosarcina sp.]
MDKKYLRYLQENRKKTGFFIIILFFSIILGIFIFHALESNFFPKVSNKAVYVAGDGSGNFTCDGTDDQIEINQALAYVAENPEFSTVYLKGPNTYVISDSILIGSDTVLEGDRSAVIKLKDNAKWQRNKPLITQKDSNGINRVTVKRFQIDGNHDNNQDKRKGEGYYNLIHFFDSENVDVHGVYMHDGHGDGLKVERSSNIKFYNNKVYKLGHDGLYAIDCQNIGAWKNTITCRTNSGLRVLNSNHVKFHNNVINSFFDWSAGGPGILIEKTTGVVNDVKVYNNTIHNTYGPGIWLIGYGNSYPKEEARNVYIHNNTFYDTGTNPDIDWVGGIVTSGFYDTLIENNVFDGVYHGAIIHMYPPSADLDHSVELSPQVKGYKTIVRNNIIVDTRNRTKDPNDTGYGVIDYLPEIHTFVLENNCLYNNTGGNYKNTNSTTDIHADPLFVNQNKHDYRLKPNSPCIGNGYRSSDPSKDSSKGNNSVNIGRYG